MSFLTDLLYWISTGLLVPVIVLLIFLFIVSLVNLGSFFGKYLSKRKATKFLNDLFKDLNYSNINILENQIPENSKLLVFAYLKKIVQTPDNDALHQQLLSDFEIRADKELSKSVLLSKLGPILGLMGTLIPMGPALGGLASGNITSMAYNMQVAFATTVLGLVAGAIGFVVHQISQRWYLQDLVKLEYVVDLYKGGDNCKKDN